MPRPGRKARSCRSSGSTSPNRRCRRPCAASTAVPRASSCTRARRGSCWTTSGSSRSSHSPRSGASPILIHGGRGLPPIAAHLHRLVDRNPGASLIVAHGGIADLAALSEAFAGHPGVFFDTSLWSGVDLLDLFSRVSPGQVLYASDYPYGMQPSSLTLALRTARAAGWSEEQLRDLLGRSAARIADGVAAPDLSPALGPRVLRQPITLARIHGYITMATPLLWTRQPDTIGILGLAINACDERDGHVDERERIAELLSCARDLWQTFPGMEDERDRLSLGRATFRLIHLADIVAVTTLD